MSNEDLEATRKKDHKKRQARARRIVEKSQARRQAWVDRGYRDEPEGDVIPEG